MSDYYDVRNANYFKKLKKVQSTLPKFVSTYLRGIASRTTVRTRISYAYDLRMFFLYLKYSNTSYRKYNLTEFKIEDLAKLNTFDIEEYMEFLEVCHDEIELMNSPELFTSKIKDLDNKKSNSADPVSQARKLSSLKSMFRYLHSHEFLTYDATFLVPTPKIDKDKIIKYLEPNEVVKLLNFIEKDAADLYKNKKLAYYNIIKERDLAIMTLLLGTGIRVSECEALSINDIDFAKRKLQIMRKGNKVRTLDFSEEVEVALVNYIDNSRNYFLPKDKEENALFLSTRKTRLSVRAYEKLVNEYTEDVFGTNNKLGPHKMRSTFATNMLDEENDIFTVSQALGHLSLEPTRKYTKLKDMKLYRAMNSVKLRD